MINFWDWPLARDAEGSWQAADKLQRDRWLRAGRMPADYPARVAEDFLELLAIVREKVKPERDHLSGNATAEGRKKRWWLYGRDAKAMYHAVGRGHFFARHPEHWIDSAHPVPEVVAFAQTSKTKYPTYLPNHLIFDQKVVVISRTTADHFALLCSTLHYVWAHARGGSGMRTDAVYTPTDIYETLAAPGNTSSALAPIGAEYSDSRGEYLLAKNVGLTGFYNRFHDLNWREPVMVHLRSLHKRLDLAVRDAYGWSDLDLGHGHGFHAVPYLPQNDRMRFTISEPARLEVLRRLSRLNRERWQAEQVASGAVSGARAASSASPRPRLELVSPAGQPDLFN